MEENLLLFYRERTLQKSFPVQTLNAVKDLLHFQISDLVNYRKSCIYLICFKHSKSTEYVQNMLCQFQSS